MLIVSVELHSAVTGAKKTLGRMIIANTGASTIVKRGDYTVHVGNKNDVNDLRKIYQEPLRFGQVLDYPRLSYNVWRLVIRALRSAFPEEK
jgi:hypothetical protein